MVKYVRDTLHGFGQRPHYEGSELDAMFEKIVVDFLNKKYGKVEFPISTEDITTIIEQDVSDLDQYADLSSYGAGVEGVTEFHRNGKPRVAISEDAHKYENRLRTTLTHEYGHVRLHSYLFGMEDRQLALGPGRKANAIYCKRDTILSTGKTDWMEWQAGYACGAVLMPRSHVMRRVGGLQQKLGIYGPISAASPNGQTLIQSVVQDFVVSQEAARVRLSVLGILGTESAVRSLFS